MSPVSSVDKRSTSKSTDKSRRDDKRNGTSADEKGKKTPDRRPAAKKAAPARSSKPRPAGTTGLFEGYAKGPYANAFDEMFDHDDDVRAPYRGIHKALAPTDRVDLENRVDALGRAFIDQGITFSLSGKERPFPLDVVPRVISATEWSKLERGITQRVQALEMFLDDIYGEQEILRDGVVPKRLVTSCEHFHRQAVGIRPPNGVRIHVAGIDLIRDENGDFRVLEDNLRSPSGVSYVMENRRTMARVFPDLFSSHRVRAVADYSSQLLKALRASAAFNEADPNVVVLTPGVANSAYFEHSLLARQMGVELVEGRDLFCRDNVVYMRTTDGEQRVDVIYRRIDDDYLDPMQFRPDSMLGVAGLVNAARAGNVVISSAVGNGVGDDKLVYTYVPEIIDYYLGRSRSSATSTPCAAGSTRSARRCSTGSTSWWSSRSRAPGATASCSGRTRPGPNWTRWRARSRPTPAGGSPSPSCSCRRCRPRSATSWLRDTWTCAHSR